MGVAHENKANGTMSSTKVQSTTHGVQNNLQRPYGKFLKTHTEVSWHVSWDLCHVSKTFVTCLGTHDNVLGPVHTLATEYDQERQDLLKPLLIS